MTSIGKNFEIHTLLTLLRLTSTIIRTVFSKVDAADGVVIADMIANFSQKPLRAEMRISSLAGMRVAVRVR